jgi:hypothetical protein
MTPDPHKPYYTLLETKRFRVIIRNHWTLWFNDGFIILIGKEKGVYKFGVFNFCICIIF